MTHDRERKGHEIRRLARRGLEASLVHYRHNLSQLLGPGS